jgi:hypothetical protein
MASKELQSNCNIGDLGLICPSFWTTTSERVYITASGCETEDFLALWKDADPDIPVLKQAKAEYAKLQ